MSGLFSKPTTPAVTPAPPMPIVDQVQVDRNAADLLRRRQHALVHAAGNQNLRLAAAFAEITQQLDAIRTGHLQIEHHHRGLKFLHGATERVRLGHALGFEAKTGRGLRDELAEVGLIVDDQQFVGWLRRHGPPYQGHGGFE